MDIKDIQAIQSRINDFEKSIVEGKRALSESERTEFRELVAELEKVNQKENTNMNKDSKNTESVLKREVSNAINSIRNNQTNFQISMKRESWTYSNAVASGAVPVNNMPIIDPLSEDTVYDGMFDIPTGVVGTTWWPYASDGDWEADLDPEEDGMSEHSLSISKKEVVKHVISGCVAIERQALVNTPGIEDFIVSQLNRKRKKKFNKLVLDPTQSSSPFYGLAASASYLGATPSYAAVMGMVGTLNAKGIKDDELKFVVSPATATKLRTTPMFANTGAPILSADNKIAGIPVFIHTDITNNYIGLGAFAYNKAEEGADFTLLTDPYTKGMQTKIRFILSGSVGLKCITSDAFILGKVADAPAANTNTNTDTED